MFRVNSELYFMYSNYILVYLYDIDLILPQLIGILTKW